MVLQYILRLESHKVISRNEIFRSKKKFEGSTMYVDLVAHTNAVEERYR